MFAVHVGIMWRVMYKCARVNRLIYAKGESVF